MGRCEGDQFCPLGASIQHGTTLWPVSPPTTSLQRGRLNSGPLGDATSGAQNATARRDFLYGFSTGRSFLQSFWRLKRQISSLGTADPIERGPMRDAIGSPTFESQGPAMSFLEWH